MYVRKAMREKDIIRSGVQWAVCTAPVCTPQRHEPSIHQHGVDHESLFRSFGVGRRGSG